MNLKYEEVYARTMGLFTPEENARIKNARLFIAGVGGIGGAQAAALARMGVAEITIMDPGVFDEPDLNRQYGALVSTLGKNKALATAEILRDIAPFTKITAYDKALSEEELRTEIKKTTEVVINSVDLSDFKYYSLVARLAREEGKYSLCAPIPDFGAVLMLFAPSGMSFAEFTGEKAFPPITPTAIKRARLGQAPGAVPFLASQYTISSAALLSGAMSANEAIMIITGRRKKEDVIAAPNVIYADLETHSIKTFNPLV